MMNRISPVNFGAYLICQQTQLKKVTADDVLDVIKPVFREFPSKTVSAYNSPNMRQMIEGKLMDKVANKQVILSTTQNEETDISSPFNKAIAERLSSFYYYKVI